MDKPKCICGMISDGVDPYCLVCCPSTAPRLHAERPLPATLSSAPLPDGEVREFYEWVLARAKALGWEERSGHDDHHLRARAMSAVAWISGAESNEAAAQPTPAMCAYDWFTLLRDAWADGFKEPR